MRTVQDIAQGLVKEIFVREFLEALRQSKSSEQRNCFRHKSTISQNQSHDDSRFAYGDFFPLERVGGTTSPYFLQVPELIDGTHATLVFSYLKRGDEWHPSEALLSLFQAGTETLFESHLPAMAMQYLAILKTLQYFKDEKEGARIFDRAFVDLVLSENFVTAGLDDDNTHIPLNPLSFFIESVEEDAYPDAILPGDLIYLCKGEKIVPHICESKNPFPKEKPSETTEIKKRIFRLNAKRLYQLIFDTAEALTEKKNFIREKNRARTEKISTHAGAELHSPKTAQAIPRTAQEKTPDDAQILKAFAVTRPEIDPSGEVRDVEESAIYVVNSESALASEPAWKNSFDQIMSILGTSPLGRVFEAAQQNQFELQVVTFASKKGTNMFTFNNVPITAAMRKELTKNWLAHGLEKSQLEFHHEKAPFALTVKNLTFGKPLPTLAVLSPTRKEHTANFRHT